MLLSPSVWWLTDSIDCACISSRKVESAPAPLATRRSMAPTTLAFSDDVDATADVDVAPAAAATSGASKQPQPQSQPLVLASAATATAAAPVVVEEKRISKATLQRRASKAAKAAAPEEDEEPPQPDMAFQEDVEDVTLVVAAPKRISKATLQRRASKAAEAAKRDFAHDEADSEAEEVVAAPIPPPMVIRAPKSQVKSAKAAKSRMSLAAPPRIDDELDETDDQAAPKPVKKTAGHKLAKLAKHETAPGPATANTASAAAPLEAAPAMPAHAPLWAQAAATLPPPMQVHLHTVYHQLTGAKGFEELAARDAHMLMLVQMMYAPSTRGSMSEAVFFTGICACFGGHPAGTRLHCRHCRPCPCPCPCPSRLRCQWPPHPRRPLPMSRRLPPRPRPRRHRCHCRCQWL